MTIWTAFYWDDYLGDTQDLSLTEHGAYLRLLAGYYATSGKISADKTRLYRLCNAFSPDEQEAVDTVVSRYFGHANGMLTHCRCDAELDRAQAKSDAARKASEKRWQSERNAGAYPDEEADAHADAMQPLSSPQPHTHTQGKTEADTKKNPCASGDAPAGSNGRAHRFDEFWSLYPTKRDKKKAREVWIRKRLDEKADLILDDVRHRQRHDGQWKEGYIPLPSTYLRNERWEDEYSRGAGGESDDEWYNRNTIN